MSPSSPRPLFSNRSSPGQLALINNILTVGFILSPGEASSTPKEGDDKHADDSSPCHTEILFRKIGSDTDFSHLAVHRVTNFDGSGGADARCNAEE